VCSGDMFTYVLRKSMIS